MIIKLNITNFSSFKKAIGECSEPVFILDGGGKKRKIEEHILKEMRQQYESQKGTLSIQCMCSPISDYYLLLAAAVWE
jgi:predicted transcriptional regulator